QQGKETSTTYGGKMMRKIAGLLILAGLAIASALAATETFSDVSVIDVSCSKKAAADPDTHTRACALGCSGSGFGFYTKEKNFVKLDAEGNKKILAELKASEKKDHFRADITGEVKGDTISVSSVKL